MAAISLAGRCAAAGHQVTVLAEDAHEAERVSDMLARRDSTTGRITVQTDSHDTPDARVALAPPTHMPGGITYQLCLGAPDQVKAVPGQVRVALHLYPNGSELAWGGTDPVDQVWITGFLTQIGAPPIHTALHPKRFAGAVLQECINALADWVLLLGAVPWEIDDALKSLGFAVGVFEAQDQAGLGPTHAKAPLLIRDRMLREGRLGRSVGVGWYRYPGGGGAVIDPLMEDMIVEEARFAGIRQQPLGLRDVQDLMMLGLACAGADMLRLGDIEDRDAFQALAHGLYGAPNVLSYVVAVPTDDWFAKLVRLGVQDHPLWQMARLAEFAPDGRV